MAAILYFVYVLRNPKGRLYIGFTSDLWKRVHQHQEDKGGWTSGRGPWELVYTMKASVTEQRLRVGNGT